MFNHIIKALMLSALCTLILTGCANTSNLLNTDNYIKETVPHKRTFFNKVSAMEEGGRFKVSGRLRVKGHTHSYIPKFVEVTLIDSAGMIIDKMKVVYSPRMITRSVRHRGARFAAYFMETPPAGTTIRLSNIN